MIHFARKLRTNQTDAEQRLWSRLRLSWTDTVVETIYEALNRKTMDGRFD